MTDSTRSRRPPNPGSRLPDEPDYWMGLKSRIVEAAQPAIRREANGSLWALFREFSPAVAAGAVLAVVGTWALSPRPTTEAEPSAEAVIRNALMPDDPLAGPLLEGESPPLARWLSDEGGTR